MSRRVGVLALALALGCGGGGTTDPGPGPGPDPDPDPAPVAAVEVTPDSGLVVVDDAGLLAVRVADSDGTVLTGRTVTWTSLDDTLATISDDGEVSALSYGDARIVATSEGKSDTVIVRARLRFTQIAPGGNLTCGLLASGAAWCWGINLHGALGARFDGQKSSVPLRVADGHRFTTITVGGTFGCGLDEDLAAWCWGENFSGKLGDGVPSTGVSYPVRVVGNHRFLTISASSDNACALDESRLAYCWGAVSLGRIPGRTSTNANFPVAVASPDRPQPLTFESLQAGNTGTCGIATEIDGGELWCWGDNSHGQVTDVTPDPVYAQVNAPLIPFLVGVGPGFTCYTGVDDETRQTHISQCRGISFSDPQHAAPSTRDYPSVARALAMDAGVLSVCALLDGGELRCWGDNSLGQLGIGVKSAAVEAPVSPNGGHTWTSMDLGYYDVCAIATDGIGYCWGDNLNGVLGDGTVDDRTEPTAVVGQL